MVSGSALNTNAFWFTKKWIQNDPRGALVIKWSFTVELLECCWNAQVGSPQTRTLVKQNSFFEKWKVRKLRRSRKSPIYHIFLTKTVNNFVVYTNISLIRWSFRICAQSWKLGLLQYEWIIPCNRAWIQNFVWNFSARKHICFSKFKSNCNHSKSGVYSFRTTYTTVFVCLLLFSR